MDGGGDWAYDVTILGLKFPENVVTVAPDQGTAPPYLRGETRLEKLHDAVCWAEILARDGIALGCSIVIYEGVYTDDLEQVPNYKVPDGFSLELVGVKDVRLVLEKNKCFGVGYANLTIKNITIVDRRLNRTCSTICIQREARVDFFRVRIDAPRACALGIMKKSQLSLSRCTISGCLNAIHSLDSDVVLDDCTISSSTEQVSTSLVHLRGSTFEATNSSFSCRHHAQEPCITCESTRVRLDDCRIDAAPNPTGTKRPAAGVAATNGGAVFLRRTRLCGFDRAGYASGSDSKLDYENCDVVDCRFGFDFPFNSQGLIKNCQLDVLALVLVVNNVKGKIKFENNRIVDGSEPKVFIDSKSVMPHHDFDSVDTTVNDDMSPELPTDKERSAHTKLTHQLLLEASARGDPPCSVSAKDGQITWKSCRKCARPQLPTDEKMKFCVECKKVCYCSKECQKADWVDHKLVCRPARPAPHEEKD